MENELRLDLNQGWCRNETNVFNEYLNITFWGGLGIFDWPCWWGRLTFSWRVMCIDHWLVVLLLIKVKPVTSKREIVPSDIDLLKITTLKTVVSMRMVQADLHVVVMAGCGSVWLCLVMWWSPMSSINICVEHPRPASSTTTTTCDVIASWRITSLRGSCHCVSRGVSPAMRHILWDVMPAMTHVVWYIVPARRQVREDVMPALRYVVV